MAFILFEQLDEHRLHLADLLKERVFEIKLINDSFRHKSSVLSYHVINTIIADLITSVI